MTISSYLFSRRDSILHQWRVKCELDSSAAHVVSLDRNEFNDHLPLILNVLEQRLRQEQETGDPTRLANFHGLLRWRLGRTIQDILKEIDYLYDIVNHEMMVYQHHHQGADPVLILQASLEIAKIKEETVRGSVAEYITQQQNAATNRSASLEQALENLNQLERDRGIALRDSSHDLKSSFGVIQGVALLLEQEGQTPEERGQLVEMLKRNITNVQQMLLQLSDLARLEAGQVKLNLEKFDASRTLQEMVAGAQPLAAAKNLMLLANGPESLAVQGDEVKIRRIVQNLMLNAIRYTSSGVVSVSWSAEDRFRWYIGIQDSGPGLPAEIMKKIGGQLRPLEEHSAVMDPESDPDLSALDEFVAEASVPPAPGGEGLGLYITKHLCEVIAADLSVESIKGKGTLFTIRIPMHYEPLQESV